MEHGRVRCSMGEGDGVWESEEGRVTREKRGGENGEV